MDTQSKQQQVKEPAAQDGPDRHGPQELARWQRLVLPVMVSAVIGAGIFFAVAIIQEIRTLYPKLEHQPVSLAPYFERFEENQPAATGDLGYLRFKTFALLEADALQSRYRQASAAMLSRIWTRQMGFLTGMLMALIGSAFILGRIEVKQTTLSAGSAVPEAAANTLKASLATTSPGIVLATLGAVLMGMAIAIPGRIVTTDTPVYLLPVVPAQSEIRPIGPVELPEPPPLPQSIESGGGTSSGGD